MMPTIQHILGTASLALMVPLTVAHAQNTNGSTENSSWIGVVTIDTSYVRCGANDSYYPIATANIGDLVRICGKRQDWYKVETAGSVFDETIGYIKYPGEDIEMLSVSGNTGTANGDVDVLAKNIDSDELYRSWRPILQLHDGDAIYIVDSIITKPGTLHREAYVVHTIQMPPNATGWINASYITRANADQIAVFDGWSSGEVTAISNAAAATDTSNTSTTTPTGEATEDDASYSDTAETTRLEPLTLAELEAMWDKITAEPVMGAEVAPLRVMYFELLNENTDDLVIARIAEGRVKQLDIWEGLQAQRVRIDSLRSELADTSEEASAYKSVMSLYGDYAIAGRLALSHTFDGRLRPFMYRIQDEKSGRTLGYIPASEEWALSGLVGQIIGVAGTSTWDPSWRVNVVDATRFDILTPTTVTASPDIQ